MQDRFKFRVWDKDRKKMFDCIQVNFTEGAHGSNSVKDNECSIHLMYQPHLELLQCTGLKDKNGRLIYEGDIVKENWHKYIIGWNRGSYDITDIKTKKCYTISGLCAEKSEVIGNIYENPELLECENNE